MMRREEMLPVTSSTALIMLVDDEPMVLKVLARTLKQQGHEVIACSGFEEAQAQLAKGISPDLLITDIVLRSSTGKRVATSVQEQSPRTKVVFMSGYSNVSVGGHAVLQKPFSNEELTTIVEQALSSGNAVDDAVDEDAPFSLSRKKHFDG